jgi:hypothetical protein
MSGSPMSDQRLPLLKVFFGAHTGAEVVLIDEEYLIGRGETCDLVLGDDSLADEHARIRFVNGRVTFTAVENSPVYLDGVPAESGELKPFQFLTLGGTHLAYGPSDAEWPELTLPVLQPIEFDDESDNENEESSYPTDQTETEDESRAGKTQKSDASSTESKDRRTRRFTAVGAAGHCGLGALLVVLTMVGGVELSQDQSAWGLDDLQKIVDQIAPNSRVKVVLKDGRYADAGYVIEESTADGLC